MTWSFELPLQEWMNARSSTIFAMLGKISETHAPDWPYCLKLYGLFISGPGKPWRTTISPLPSSTIPLYFSSAGLYWNVSTWLTPPLMNREITAFARGLKCGAFGIVGELVTPPVPRHDGELPVDAGAANSLSLSSRLNSANPPIPEQASIQNCRRETNRRFVLKCLDITIPVPNEYTRTRSSSA